MGYRSGAKHLPSMNEALGSSPSTTKKEKKGKKMCSENNLMKTTPHNASESNRKPDKAK